MDKETLKAKYKDEQVLVIPRVDYERCVSLGVEKPLEYTITNFGYFDYRYEVEMDETVLQVIPYVVLKHEDKYFATKRLGGDHRLQGMVAFLGGHVNLCDWMFSGGSKMDAIHTMRNCLLRELQEETTFIDKMLDSIKLMKEFVDNSSQVSRCHVCQLVLAYIDSADIEIRETDKLEGGWFTLDELNKLKLNGKTEGWCDIAIDILNNLE